MKTLQKLNISILGWIQDPRSKISQFFRRPSWIQGAGWNQPWNIERVSILQYWGECPGWIQDCFAKSLDVGPWIQPNIERASILQHWGKRGGHNQGPRVHILLESGLVCFDVLTSTITIQQKTRKQTTQQTHSNKQAPAASSVVKFKASRLEVFI